MLISMRCESELLSGRSFFFFLQQPQQPPRTHHKKGLLTRHHQHHITARLHSMPTIQGSCSSHASAVGQACSEKHADPSRDAGPTNKETKETAIRGMPSTNGTRKNSMCDYGV